MTRQIRPGWDSFGPDGCGWRLDREEDGAEQVPAALWGRLVGQPGGDHLAQLGDQLLEFLTAEPDGVLPEADEITEGVERPQHVDAAVVGGIADWLAPGRGRGPIARLFSGPRRLHRLCGGRLR